MIGVDEHVRRRGGDRLVTVIVDPAPVRERRGLLVPAVPSRAAANRLSKHGWRAQARLPRKRAPGVVAMDGIGRAPRSTAAEEDPVIFSVCAGWG